MKTVDEAHVGISATDGIVTSSGHVRSWAAKEQAQNAAWSAPGVAEVDNEIVVTS